MTKKQLTIPKLKKKLDRVFCLYTRLKEVGGRNKFGRCVTCGKKFGFKKLDAGHFISRNYTIHRWNPINVHTQCQRCNRFSGGEIEEYFLWMEVEYGREVVDDLISHKHDIVKLDRQWLLDKIEYYKKLIKDYE